MSTVLVVEDQAETRRPLIQLLKLEGHQVLTAENADAAVAAIRNDSPDLVLLDIGIAPVDGLTLLTLLRGEPQTRDVRVILVTGHADESILARASQLGVRHCLIKSRFTADELLSLVRQHARAGAADDRAGRYS